jgi:predicted ATPase
MPLPVIRTPDQRLRVFVSSTLKELNRERTAARDAVYRLNLIPVMFELGARPHQARDIYKAYIEQSHIFIGIYGDHYGWVGPGMEISGLEEEYNLATRIPRLIYIKSDPSKRDPRLQKMLHSIRDREGISYKYFNEADELRELITNDLSLLLSERFESSLKTSSPSGQSPNKTDIPAQRTPLIGREKDLDELLNLIIDEKSRLITLTGTGGSGKTRLSLELAQRLVDIFDELYFVELAALTDHHLTASTIGKTIGLREAGTRTPDDQLIDYVRGRNILFVLDNFEQIRDASSFVIRLLEASQGIYIIISSRIALRIRGEREYQVRPLDVPDVTQGVAVDELMKSPSVQLFYRCARAVNPSLKLTDEHATIMADICSRLDGLPLAIELAAARVNMLSLREIRDKLQKKLLLLSKGARDLPERHKTMRNAIGWSHDLLDEKAKMLFRRMSVFSGGCTLTAIEQVCNKDREIADDITDLVESLLEMNLVRMREKENGEIRFEIFEIIREYALECSNESSEKNSIENLHGAYFLEFVRQIEPFFRTGERDKYLARVENDLDNIRAVFTRSLEKEIDPGYGIELVGFLGWFFHLRGYLNEGRAWATSLLNLPEVESQSEHRARVLFPAGGLAWSQSDYNVAVRYLQESSSLFKQMGNKYWQVQSQILLAGSLAGLKKYDQAYKYAFECVGIAREIGDRWGEAYSLYWLGDILFLQSANAVASRTVYEQSLAIYSELRDDWGVAEARGHLGIITTYQGDYESAEFNLENSLATMESIGDRWAVARSLTGLGDVYFHRKEFVLSACHYSRAIGIWRELGNIPGLKMSLTGLARIAAERGDARRAARLLGNIEHPYIIIGILILSADPSEYEKFKGNIRNQLTEAEWKSESEKGYSMSLDEIIKYASSDNDS